MSTLLDQPSAEPRSAGLCIFCLTDDGGFKSEEHVVSETLGNKSLVLPAGFVCDRCNNGVLSNCDEALLRFPLVDFRRTSARMRNKKGRLPKMIRGATHFHALDTPNDDMLLQGPGAFVEAEGLMAGFMEESWSELLFSRAARSLLKAGLEAIAFNEGKAAALQPAYDGVRRAVLEGISGLFFFRPTMAPYLRENTFAVLPFDVMPNRKGLVSLLRFQQVHVGAVWPAMPREAFEIEGLTNGSYQFVKYATKPSRTRFDTKLDFTFSFEEIIDTPDDSPVWDAVRAPEETSRP